MEVNGSSRQRRMRHTRGCLRKVPILCSDVVANRMNTACSAYSAGVRGSTSTLSSSGSCNVGLSLCGKPGKNPFGMGGRGGGEDGKLKPCPWSLPASEVWKTELECECPERAGTCPFERVVRLEVLPSLEPGVGGRGWGGLGFSGPRRNV